MQIKFSIFSPSILNAFLFTISSFLLTNCARMGNPDGGWYDEKPPKVIHSSPKDKAVEVKSNKITIGFDEYIKLENATDKVVISPPQIEMPEIKTSGKKIIIEIKDSLKEDFTYTIDFSDAITDNNEGNPMGNYTYSFSTGERIDTLEVAGNVLEADNLEPIKGILVGLYDDFEDSIFTTQPMLRVARTDSRGHFVIKGIAPGNYRIYALQDADGDYIFTQKSEMIAFSYDTISPYCHPDIRQDTVWKDSLHIDSIIKVEYTHYRPDDLVLLAFTEKQTDHYLIKTERTDPRKIILYFSCPNDSLPLIEGLNFNAQDVLIAEPNEGKDTIVYWIRDTTYVNLDTLSFALSYLATDTLGELFLQTDTIEAIPKESYAKRKKAQDREWEDWKKAQEKKKKRDEPYDTVMPIKNIEIIFKSQSSLDPDKNILFEMPVPLVRMDTSAFHLYSKIDTLWYNAPFEIEQIEGSLRQYILRGEWRYGVEYSFEVDSAAVEDLYGYVNSAVKRGIKVRNLEEYASVLVNISGIEDTVRLVVRLLNSGGNVVKTAVMEDNTVEFFYVTPGKYYLNAFIDRNKNDVWDTGDYASHVQPEEVFYNPKELECKATWDLTVSWNPKDLSKARQKASAITKQKPDQDKKLKNKNAQRAEEKGIEYVPKD